MFTFESPATSKKNWKLYLKSQKEMLNIYYEDTEPKEDSHLNGITEYPTATVYIDKDIDGFCLIKTLRHELMHVYLWDVGKNGSYYWEDEICEIMSVVAPLICKTADDIALKIKKKQID